MVVNSDYKCKVCKAPTENLPGYPYRRIGIRHKAGCEFFHDLQNKYPDLMERIRVERDI